LELLQTIVAPDKAARELRLARAASGSHDWQQESFKLAENNADVIAIKNREYR
jgi:hypothetical protein